MDDTIKRFSKDVCEILKIKAPKVVIDAKKMRTPTQQGAYTNGVLYLKDDKRNPDLFFAIAHELRHAWQMERNPDLYLKDYKTADQFADDGYNWQVAELDANAFGYAVMVSFFKIRPIFYSFSAELKAEIAKRASEMMIFINK